MKSLSSWWVGVWIALLGVGELGAQDRWIGVPPGAETPLLASSRTVEGLRVDAVDLGAGGEVVALERLGCGELALAQKAGVVSRFAAAGDMRLRARAQLGQEVLDLAVSSRGLLVAFADGAALLDPTSLVVTRSWPLAQVRHVAAAPGSDLGLVFRSSSTYGRPTLATVLDLATGEPLGEVGAGDLGTAPSRHPSALPLIDFQMAELSPDGASLLVMSFESLHRVALGRPSAGPAARSVTASSSYSASYGPERLLDGNQNSYWIGALNAAPWTLTTDLGSVQSASRLAITWYSSSSYQGSQVDVLTSTNGTTWTALAAGLDGAAVADLDLGGAQARYVRVVIRALNGGSFPVIRELSVDAVDMRSALRLEQSGPRIGQNPQRIEVSADGAYVALPSGGGNYAVADHPNPGAYGLYVYAVDDLLQPVLAFRNGAYPRALGFDGPTRRIYSSDFDHQLVVFDALGQRRADYVLTQRGDEPRRQLVAAQGGQVFMVHMRGNALTRVTLP